MRLRIKNDTPVKNLLTIILVVVILGGVWLAVNTSKISTGTEGLKASGIYGVSLSYDSIEEVALKDTLPNNFNKVNGADWIGGVHLGNYKAQDMPKIKAFIKSGNGPFIYIKTKDNMYFIINTKDKTETENLYKEIGSKIKR